MWRIFSTCVHKKMEGEDRWRNCSVWKKTYKRWQIFSQRSDLLLKERKKQWINHFVILTNFSFVLDKYCRIEYLLRFFVLNPRKDFYIRCLIYNNTIHIPYLEIFYVLGIFLSTFIIKEFGRGEEGEATERPDNEVVSPERRSTKEKQIFSQRNYLLIKEKIMNQLLGSIYHLLTILIDFPSVFYQCCSIK